MAEIVSVRFRSEGKQYYFDPQGLTCRPGDGLIVETASGQGVCPLRPWEFPVGGGPAGLPFAR